MSLREGIREAINKASAEKGSDTPDFILAKYLTECLAAFDRASVSRDKWYEEKAKFSSGECGNCGALLFDENTTDCYCT